jgi:hypothetical protein
MNNEKQFIKDHALREPLTPCEFKLGDTVTFTNDQGVKFYDKKITGFAKKDDYLHDKFIYLSTDAYWFPHSPQQLTKQN